MPPSDDRDGYTGFQNPTSAGSEHLAERLHIEAVMDERRTSVPVRVVKVYPDPNGGAPTADVVPLVHQTDGLLNPTVHGTIYGVSVGRVHSGSGAVISDPVAGDTYILHAADRDISRVKATGAAAAPGSYRRGSLADGMLTHALLSGKPTQAVVFKPEGGVKLYDKGGAIIETSADGKTVYITPAAGGTLYLGGDPADGGTFDFLMTASAPCVNAKGKTG